MTITEAQMNSLILQLEKLKDEIMDREISYSSVYYKTLPPNNLESARNLLHYLALRSFDLRPLQEELTNYGLSSLSHAEAFTRGNIENILQLLYRISGREPSNKYKNTIPILDYSSGRKKLQANTTALFGTPFQPGSRIMVTMPDEAADDTTLVENLLLAGMDIARINCSHGSPQLWNKMIWNIRQAKVAQGKKCLIHMDLPGPKIRTGKISSKLISKKNKKKGPGIRLYTGDILEVYKRPVTGSKARRKNGEVVTPARISVSLPEVWSNVKPGEKIYFDDGKIGGKIIEDAEEFISVRITRARPEKGNLLREDKGVNLPETNLNLPSLTVEDLEILPFICKHADMLGFSFVRKAADVERMQQELKKLNQEDFPVILKIETSEAFKNLPELLLQSMRSPVYGIMLARGDLAIEVGFTRIAEVQEQVLWLCEAAHVPVIWATQVLENLLKDGVASRAEITDAAMAVRAECVMLNKGPFVEKAMKAIRNIDNRMIQHMSKKHGALRPLNVAKDFWER
ncbi:pyruvate kinase [Antarcticibacterium flavum]|uniref:Pyruvate kinase n=1 Tax=Antarcticibacterium flavum TaxID=2058175 RepID=A0A5B7X0H7_9FLAO|nr:MULTISPECIES: pyruvate kinase [Antarcticibacterium]MCM4159834.1 pyruvate kinase [Antarcticibacterium sp. W02-3]QCY68837.1 pyruvate kinase [Antarcticibacterium flavum]